MPTDESAKPDLEDGTSTEEQTTDLATESEDSPTFTNPPSRRRRRSRNGDQSDETTEQESDQVIAAED